MMEEAAYYVGSIARFRGSRITQRRRCACPQCRLRAPREDREDPRLMLTLDPGNGAAAELLIHARPSSVEIQYVEF